MILDREALLAHARQHPASVRFREFVTLMDAFGWRFARQRGSHQTFHREGGWRSLHVQPSRNGMAKEYQVRQFLHALDDGPRQRRNS
jgi:predicted RNA binding protein YcfA (HicA-like mRNA interferase family)